MNFTFSIIVFLAFAAIGEWFTWFIDKRTPLWWVGTLFRTAVILLGFLIMLNFKQENEFLQKGADLQTERYEKLDYIYSLYTEAIVSYSNYLWERDDSFQVDTSLVNEISVQENLLDSINREYDMCIK